MTKKRQRIKIDVGDAWHGIATGETKVDLEELKKKFGGRNFVAKHDKNKGGRHKSKKDYDRKSLVQRLKKFIKGL